VYVCVPSEEARAHWGRAGERASLSPSRFPVDRVETSVGAARVEGFPSAKDLSKENVQLQEANECLAEGKRRLVALVENLEEVRRLHRERRSYRLVVAEAGVLAFRPRGNGSCR